MNKLSAKQIVEINNRLTGSDSGETYIEAVSSVLNEVYRKDEKNFYVYKDTIEKASVLACELHQRKVFTYKNLTTSVFSLFMLLNVNGVSLPEKAEIKQEILKTIRFNDKKTLEILIRKYCGDKYAMIIDAPIS